MDQNEIITEQQRQINEYDIAVDELLTIIEAQKEIIEELKRGQFVRNGN